MHYALTLFLCIAHPSGYPRCTPEPRGVFATVTECKAVARQIVRKLSYAECRKV